MKLAICEDKANDINLLLKLIKEIISSVNLDVEPEVSLFTCGEELEYYYSNGNNGFDIIFLDILMSGKDGIKTAREIRKYDSECIIIFTTISTEYALEGYSVFAYNYIVKPLTINKLKPVFLKAKEVIDQRNQKSLCIRSSAKIQVIHYRNIKYITSLNCNIKCNSITENHVLPSISFCQGKGGDFRRKYYPTLTTVL
ncbi:MAG TPA: response regulator [Clostridiales bacterium]|nr:response regulator [Clostridiales bacterium]